MFVFDCLACLPGIITFEQVGYVYPFKLFRYIQIQRTFAQMEEIVASMKRRYMQDSIVIGNIYSIIRTIFILLMIFHLFACCWIYIGKSDGGWISA
jgi:hypothetical protein